MTDAGLIFKELRATDSDPIARTGPITSGGNISPYFSNIPFDENSIIRFDPRGNIWITSKKDGIFVLESSPREFSTTPFKVKVYGDTQLTFWKNF